jgi:hypothetical protein
MGSPPPLSWRSSDMRRVSHEEISRNIAIQITCIRGPTKTALQHMQGEQAVKEATRIIMEHCLGGCVVLAPDPVSAGNWGTRSGKFGVTEPWPFEKGHKPPQQ